jgi:hypothetical protein
MNKIELAEATYRKALALIKDERQRKHATCVYAEFVAKKMGDAKRACELQRNGGCPESACGQQ